MQMVLHHKTKKPHFFDNPMKIYFILCLIMAGCQSGIQNDSTVIEKSYSEQIGDFRKDIKIEKLIRNDSLKSMLGSNDNTIVFEYDIGIILKDNGSIDYGTSIVICKLGEGGKIIPQSIQIMRMESMSSWNPEYSNLGIVPLPEDKPTQPNISP